MQKSAKPPKYHLVETSDDDETLCRLPVTRRRYVSMARRNNVRCCDICRLEADRIDETWEAHAPRGGSAGPMGGPGAGPDPRLIRR